MLRQNRRYKKQSDMIVKVGKFFEKSSLLYIVFHPGRLFYAGFGYATVLFLCIDKLNC